MCVVLAIGCHRSLFRCPDQYLYRTVFFGRTNLTAIAYDTVHLTAVVFLSPEVRDVLKGMAMDGDTFDSVLRRVLKLDGSTAQCRKRYPCPSGDKH